MKKSIKVDKSNNTVTVQVELEERIYASQPIQVVKHKDIEDMLQNEGFSLQKVLKYDRIDNENGNKTKGEWIFLLEGKKEHTTKKEVKKKTAKVVAKKKEETVVISNHSSPKTTSNRIGK